MRIESKHADDNSGISQEIRKEKLKKNIYIINGHIVREEKRNSEKKLFSYV